MIGEALWLCPFAENNTVTPLPTILLDNGTLSVAESGAAPLLSHHGKDIRTAHVLSQRRQKWQRAAESPALQTSFIKLELTVSLFSEKYTGNVFSSLFHFSITGGCFLHLCPWNMPLSFQLNCMLLKFLPVNLPSLHPSAVRCYWAVFLSLLIILMIFYLSYMSQLNNLSAYF